MLCLCIKGQQIDHDDHDHEEGDDHFHDLAPADYCRYTCTYYKEDVANTACHCKRKGNRQDLQDNLVAYRTIWLTEHNHYRELVASGREKRKGVTSASNMLIMNYDLDLEYMARCLARNKFVGLRDGCRVLRDGRQAGQNLAGLYEIDNTTDRSIKMISEWYV